jgi:hypothetical protein
MHGHIIQYPLNWRLGGPQRRCPRFGEQTNLFSPAGIRILVCTLCSLFTIPTTLSRLMSWSTQHISMKFGIGIYTENEVSTVDIQEFWRCICSIWGTAVAQWLRYCATNRKVAGSIPDGVTGVFHWYNPSDPTMALRSTQPLTEMSTRSISWG